ncbi:MAG: hypothetical protein JWN74_1259 [Acidobacteriaceae bacterium]|nr:hypothetical protein [Acidobacteriaceae bacterium]
MSLLDRRGFVKTCLATAAGASPLYVKSSRALSLLPNLGEASSFTSLESGDQQLRVSSAGAPFGFQNFLHVADEWRPATLPRIPLVTGPSFPLKTSRVSRKDSTLICEGSASAEDLDGKSVSYRWNADISAHSQGGDPAWFRFRTALKLPRSIRLRQGSHVEPQIIVWLNSNSTLMEGQSGSWRRVLLQQPTRNSLGAWGNDLPAVYLLDQNVGVETMMYFDVGDMEWMGIENIPRFLVYRCSSVSRIERDGTQRLGIGLIADQATGNVLPAGEVRFTYWLRQTPLTTLLTEQQAVARWLQALLPLFEEKLDWPRCGASWKDFATGTVANLQEKSQTQVEAGGHTGLRAYVKESSQLWKQPADNFELMTLTDVLWPSLLYLRLHPSAPFQAGCKQLVDDLPGFYHADTHSVSNDFVRPTNERADSWYPFENGLIKYPMIGSLAGSEEVKAHFLDAFANAEKMAHEYDYLFPIYYEVSTLQAQGAGTNYAVGGLYAWAALIASSLTKEEHYRAEAKQAVQALCTVPAERLFHEPQELAYGALAAAELGLHEQANYLLCEQLRMFYWYSDPSQKTHDIRGMVQAAASILYPAFKENVEAILPWTAIMKRRIVSESLLRFMDQQRRNNFSFFEKCSEDRRNVPMGFIPFENLGTLELGGQTGNVGKEIYGAGECIWMYLMFEALGQVSDRELMMVNLDLLDTFDAQQFPPRQLNFVLYNPTAEARSGTITIPSRHGTNVHWSNDGKPITETLNVPGRAILRLVADFDMQ